MVFEWKHIFWVAESAWLSLGQRKMYVYCQKSQIYVIDHVSSWLWENHFKVENFNIFIKVN